MALGGMPPCKKVSLIIDSEKKTKDPLADTLTAYSRKLDVVNRGLA